MSESRKEPSESYVRLMQCPVFDSLTYQSFGRKKVSETEHPYAHYSRRDKFSLVYSRGKGDPLSLESSYISQSLPTQKT